MSGTNEDGRNRARRAGDEPDVGGVLALFADVSDRTARVLAETTDWSESGRRAGQYRVDLDVDAACVAPILHAGYAVLSEETGLQEPAARPGVRSAETGSQEPAAGSERAVAPGAASGPGGRRGVVVVDPLDGSTNASLGLPWCNTALCLVVDGVPEVAMVSNLVTGDRFHAVRGGGAYWRGAPIEVSDTTELADAIVALNGAPARPLGWRQYRAMGSAELDICYVARGAFDAFADVTHGHLGVWDYLAGMLVLVEAGGVMVDAFERELVVLDHDARRAPIAAATPALLDELVRAHHTAP